MAEEYTIEKQILGEIRDYQYVDIYIVDGFGFNQYEMIQDIYRKYNSRFKQGDIDVEGDKKYFYNIVRNPCKVTTKSIDFDTKHINIQTASGQDPLKTWFFERDLKFWMKDQNFGKVLNRVFDELPIFGSVVLKIIDNKPFFVDLRNFMVEKSADTLEQSNFIVEVHNYIPAEYKKWAEKFGWENTAKILEEHQNTKEPYITVFERYGMAPKTEGSDELVYKRIFAVETGSEKRDIATDYGTEKAVIVKEEEIEKHPYWEFHLEKIPGRWLGIGVVETLLDAQIRQNEVANQLSKATYYASLHAWQTTDETVNVNIQTEVRNGQILTSDAPINPIDMTERNLSYFTQETQKWMQIRDELTFSFDVVQGERLPAGTPLGSAQLAATMAGSYFDQLRENIALDVKELLYTVIIPQFEKENKSEHILRLAGEDLDKIQNLLINQKATNELFKFLRKKGRFPSNLQYETIKVGISENVKQKKEQMVKIPKGFYDNLKYKIDIDITGEARDVRVEAQNITMLFQAVTADPTLAPPEVKRKLFMKLAENAGINPADLTPDGTPSLESLSEQVPQRAGGGVSRPSMPSAPIQGQSQTKV